MPNYKPRGRKPPTTLWWFPQGGTPPHQGDPNYLLMNLEIRLWPKPDLEEIIRDFRIMMTEHRHYFSRGNSFVRKLLIHMAARELREPELQERTAIVKKLGLQGARADIALQEVRWPSAKRVAKRLGHEVTPTEVRKTLRKVRKPRRARRLSRML